jgi:hypothetical protein
MDLATEVICTLAGVACIMIALRDGFDVLFHAGGRLALNRVLMRGSWRLFHGLARRRPRAVGLAGPFALLAILVSWALLLVFGWALLMWPQLPHGFRYASELGPAAQQHDFVDALYVSLVTLGTIGYGDISPSSDVLRVLVPLEAVVGFGLLTAAISWLLSVYPALSRRRSLAYEVTLLSRALATDDDLLRREADAGERVYSELLSRLVAVERDLLTIPIAYYFSEHDDRFSLPIVMPWLLWLADAGLADDAPPAVRLRAQMLRAAIDDFARTTAERFHGAESSSTRRLLAGYARDHLRAPHEPAPARSGPQPVA